MDSKKMIQHSGYGRLPSTAPLANPYVPFQIEDPAKYEPRTAIIRGTLFPGLDLPFMNMVNNKELPVTPLTELQTVGFVLQELALYLDTHRDDKEAFEVFQTFQWKPATRGLMTHGLGNMQQIGRCKDVYL